MSLTVMNERLRFYQSNLSVRGVLPIYISTLYRIGSESNEVEETAFFPYKLILA